MRGFLAILRRELAHRRFILVASLAAAVVPFLVPAARGLSGIEAREARAGVALVLALSLLYGLSSFLSATVIPVRIADRRIGFDFARPVSSFAIWGGTLVAIDLLAVGAGALAALPAVLADPESFRDVTRHIGTPSWLELGVIVPGFLLFAGLVQAFSVSVRSRSWLIALDFVLVLVAGTVVLLALQTILFMDGGDLFNRLAWVVLISFSIGVFAATYAAVAGGRTELRAAHRAQSRVLWSIVGTGLLGVWAWLLWIVFAPPGRMTSVSSVVAAPAGNWAVVHGYTGTVVRSHLVNLETREYRRLRTFPLEYPAFSANGDRSAWLGVKSERLQLVTADLSSQSPTTKEIPLDADLRPRLLLLDKTGARAVLAGPDRAIVFDMNSGARVATVPFSTGNAYPRGYFVHPGLLRLTLVRPVADKRYRLELYEIDVPANTISETGAIENLAAEYLFLAVDPSGSRLLAKMDGLWIADARDGRRLATLQLGPAKFLRARFLADGRIVVAESTEDSGRLSVHSQDGLLMRTIAIPEVEHLSIGGEISPGVIIVGSGGFRSQTIYAADVDTGMLRTLGDGMSPVLESVYYFSPLNARPAPGAPATRLFYADDGSLVRLDPATGSLTVLLGKPQSGRGRQ